MSVQLLDAAELLDPSRVKQKNMEIKLRTQCRLQQSESLRKLAHESATPIDTPNGREAREARRRATASDLPSDDDFCAMSPDAVLRTAQRDAQMRQIKSSTEQSLLTKVPSMFVQETIVQSQEPTQGWRSSKHVKVQAPGLGLGPGQGQGQGQAPGWAQGLRCPAPAPSGIPSIRATANIKASTSLGRGTTLGSDMFESVVARDPSEPSPAPAVAPAPVMLPLLPALGSASASQPLSPQEVARYFGESGRAQYYRTYQQLERQRNIVDYRYARQNYQYTSLPSPAPGSLLGAGAALLHLSDRETDALHRLVTHPEEDNALVLAQKALVAAGVYVDKADPLPFLAADLDPSLHLDDNPLVNYTQPSSSKQYYGMDFTTGAKPGGDPYSANSSVASSYKRPPQKDSLRRGAIEEGEDEGEGWERDEASVVSSIEGEGEEGSVLSLNEYRREGGRAGDAGGPTDEPDADHQGLHDPEDQVDGEGPLVMEPLHLSQLTSQGTPGAPDSPPRSADSCYAPNSPRAVFLARLIERDLPPSAVAMLRSAVTPRLNLSHMDLSNEVAVIMSECLQQLPLLSSLNLAGNALSDKAVGAVVGMGCNPHTLSELDLSKNRVRGRAATELSCLLAEDGCALRKLALRDVGLDNAGLQVICETLAESGNRTLAHLDVGSNHFPSISPAAAAAAGSNSNSSSDSASQPAAQSLANLVSACPLRRLDAGWCNLRGPPAEALCSAVRASALRILDLSLNPLPPAALLQLAESVALSRHLRQIVLRDCGVGGRACLALAVAARTSRSVRAVELDGNPIGRTGMLALTHVMLHHRNRFVRFSAKRCAVLGEGGGDPGLSTGPAAAGAGSRMPDYGDCAGEWSLQLGSFHDHCLASVLGDLFAADAEVVAEAGAGAGASGGLLRALQRVAVDGAEEGEDREEEEEEVKMPSLASLLASHSALNAALCSTPLVGLHGQLYAYVR